MATIDEMQKKRNVVNNQLNAPSDGGMFMKNVVNTNSMTTPKVNTPTESFQAPSVKGSPMATAGANALAPNTLMQQNPAMMNKGNPVAPATAPMTTSAGPTPTAPQPSVKPIEVDFAKDKIFDKQREIMGDQYGVDKDYLNKQYDQAVQQLNQQRENQLKQHGVNVEEVNKNYKDAMDQLSGSLYQQQELSNVEAQRRGISNSPQAIGLKNANNQTYQKNLVKITDQKLKLLSDLNMKLSELEQGYGNNMANLNLDVLGKQNELITNRNSGLWDIGMAEKNDSKK